MIFMILLNLQYLGWKGIKCTVVHFSYLAKQILSEDWLLKLSIIHGLSSSF